MKMYIETWIGTTPNQNELLHTNTMQGTLQILKKLFAKTCLSRGMVHD